ncbi:MAG: MFS transporter [Pseudomonadota bacterium]
MQTPPPTAPTSPPAQLSPRRELWLLITLAGIQFTHILDFMIMMPLGPQFTALFSITDAQFGLLVSAYTLAAGASGLVASTYIDRFGRKRLLLVLYVLFGLATLACGLAPTYGSLMAARIAAGIFGGVMSALSQTIVGDVIPFERRGRAMGIVMTSFSVSTVAGVPLGLFIAAHLGWHASFIGIALLCAVFAVFAALTLPALTAHLHVKDRPSTFAGIAGVLADRNHQKAFVFTALTMFAAFTIIPYITIYMQANAGLRADQVPWVYLCGGAGTLVSARLLGRMTDSRGKVPTYRMLGIGMLVPLFAMTLIHNVPVWVILAVSTLFFMSSSGRMIPGMAIVTSAANPRLRGTFMTLNASVQSAAMGLAAFVGGLIISRDANGLVQDYWVAAAAGACASLLAVWMAGRLTLHGAPVAGGTPEAAAKS